jgi:hypothetical protein
MMNNLVNCSSIRSSAHELLVEYSRCNVLSTPSLSRMAEGLETNLSRRNLGFEFMNSEQEREKRNTHTHKETMTEKGTDQGKVSNEIKAPDLEQFS